MKVKNISKTPSVHSTKAYPTPTAGGIFRGEDLPASGGNDGRESKYVRCSQCGFICNVDRDPEGSGWGNETSEAITTHAGATAKSRNPVITGGCPCCGSSNYKG